MNPRRIGGDEYALAHQRNKTLTTLRHLNLSFTRITDLEPLEGLIALPAAQPFQHAFLGLKRQALSAISRAERAIGNTRAKMIYWSKTSGLTFVRQIDSPLRYGAQQGFVRKRSRVQMLPM
jgi:hypothetical protein